MVFSPGHSIGHEAEHQALASRMLSAENNRAGRNYIINGNMDVAQRIGPSNPVTVLNGTYALDRWQHRRDGTAGTVTIEQKAFTTGLYLSGESTYYLRLNQTVSGTGQTYKAIEQIIEDVQQLAGQWVVTSFWARSGIATTITARLDQTFGTGGSAYAPGTPFTFPLPANVWTFCTFNYLVPSCSGKVIGPGSGTPLFLFDLSVNGPAVNSLDFAQASLQVGTVPSNFAYLKRSFAEELALCMRYYQKSFPYGTTPAQNVAAGRILFPWSINTAANGFWYFPFKVPLRTSGAAVTFYNPSAANAFAANYRAATLSANTTALNTTAQDNGFEVVMTGTGYTAGDLMGLQWTADIEL